MRNVSSGLTPDQIHAALTGFNQFNGFFLLQSVGKDDPLQVRKPRWVPIVQIGFQDELV